MGIAQILGPPVSQAPIDPAAIVMFSLAFALALCLSLRRPGLGVAMLIAVLPYDLARDVGPTTISLAKVTLVGLSVALLARRTPLAVLRTREALTVGGGALAILIATLVSVHAADFRGPAIRESLKALQYLGAFVVAALAMRTERDGIVVQRALAGTTAGVSLLALAQLVTGAPSGVWFGERAIPRIAGPLEGPNQLSGFLGLTLACIVAWTLTPVPRARERALALGALGLGIAALLLTLSRAGVSTALGAIVLVMLLAPRNPATRGGRRSVITALGAGLIAGVGVLGGVAYTLSHSVSLVRAVFDHFGAMSEVEHAGGVGNRSILWHAALTLWRGHPIFGVGAGNFELEIGRAGPRGVRTHANSLYLQSLVEGGLPLFLATVGSVTATLAVIFEGVRRGSRDPLVLGAACGLGGLAVHQIFDLLVFYPKVGDLAWTLAGAAVAALVPPAKPQGRDVLTSDTLRGTTFPPAPAESSSTR